MTTDLHLHSARMATARAHISGAESAALAADGHHAQARATRRRYWREVASAQLLIGHRWEAAERLGADQ